MTQTPRTGWTVASEGGETVGVEVSITPELRREGLAREVIRLIQDARKSDGLHVSDRITVAWEATDPDLSAALTEHGQLIAGEVLADQFGPRHGPGHGPGPGRAPARRAGSGPDLLAGPGLTARWSGSPLTRAGRDAGLALELVGLAGAAGHELSFLGLLPGHDLQITGAEEPDQDASAAVVAGHSGHHGHLDPPGPCLAGSAGPPAAGSSAAGS